jgi:hypothetical protein
MAGQRVKVKLLSKRDAARAVEQWDALWRLLMRIEYRYCHLQQADSIRDIIRAEGGRRALKLFQRLVARQSASYRLYAFGSLGED